MSPRALSRHGFALLALLVAIAIAAFAMPGADADSYSDDAYRQHDLDSMQRTLGRQLAELGDIRHLSKLGAAGNETFLSNVGTQLADLPQYRLYTGLSQLLPGGAVGEPEEFHRLGAHEVNFLSRTGAKLNGRIFWDGRPGPHPMITITSGSIQGPQSGYWWAGQLLAANGYIVFTWDTQGQGESETFGHEPGDPMITTTGFPSQQSPNFVNSTVDAIRFLMSTPEAPYRPDPWTQEELGAARRSTRWAGEAINWFNPFHSVTDRTNLGLAGHSLGASAVSIVAQCSDQSSRWTEVKVCPDEGPLPIRAVVGWDSLSAGDDVKPVVPGMNQQGDGYFLNPQPELEAPNPKQHLGTHDAYVGAGVDTYSISIRGATHLEWSFIPLILPATSYGLDTARYYTLAWMDRYVHPSADRRTTAGAALLAGPVPDGATNGRSELAWRANFLSAKRLSAFAFDGHTATDLRAYAGLSPVGDWAGANADTPTPR